MSKTQTMLKTSRYSQLMWTFLFMVSFASTSALLGEDWTQWGGTNTRNNSPTGNNILTHWEVGQWDKKSETWKNQEQIRWYARIGSFALSTPVIANGKVFIGGSSAMSYDPAFPALKNKGAVDFAPLFCFEEKSGQFLWQHTNLKLKTGRVNDWPSIGICTSPCVDGDRLWYVTNRCEVVCLDVQGFHDNENDGPFREEPHTNKEGADVIWKFDMIKEFQVFPHNMTCTSPLCVGETLFLNTCNGVDETHTKIPSPDAPSFLALDRNTGKVLWSDNSPGKNILHGQWSSPAYGVFQGVPQVIFAGGDGWIYSFDPQGDGKGNSKLLWKFDCNAKTALWKLGGKATRNNILATPVISQNKVYVAVGQDPEHGEGPGQLWCIDPTKRGDVSPTLAVDAKGKQLPHRRIQAIDESKGEREIQNGNSAAIWTFQSSDLNQNGKIEFEEELDRCMGSPVIKDNILIIADTSGILFCLDATTGKAHWSHDLLAIVWGSTMIVEDKIYVGDQDGMLSVFKLNQKKELISQIEMDNCIYATPVVANDVLYIVNQTTLFAIAPE